jgi:hypothetical protein
VANQSAPFTITVATAASTSLSHIEQPPLLGRDRDLLAAQIRRYPAALPLAVFLILGLLSFRRVKSISVVVENSRAFSGSASAIIVTLVALTLSAVAGCGGASTIATAPTTATPTAESQTYTITVTPTASTSDSLPAPSVQPITLTLVVN